MTAQLIASQAAWTDDGTATVLGSEVFAPDATGLVTLKLRPNSELAQTDTYYRITVERSPTVYYAVVPDAGPVELISILVDPATLNPVGPIVAPLFQLRSERGQANGYASLGSDGKVPTAQLPASSGGEAVPPDRRVDAGAGLTGGGDLSVNRTIALNASSIASLGKADTAIQPGSLAAVATSGAYADLSGRPAIPDGRYALAAKFGCVGVSADPDSINATTPFIAMSSGRQYAFRMAVQPGQLISSIRLPIKDAAAGAGAVTMAVYQADLSTLGTTGDVAATFLSATPESWLTVPLLVPATAATGFVWVSWLSTMATGAQFGVVNVPNFAEVAWVLNTSGTKNAVQLDGVGALPATLNPAGMNNYLDAVVGVA